MVAVDSRRLPRGGVPVADGGPRQELRQ
jgi:hypothetical protein